MQALFEFSDARILGLDVVVMLVDVLAHVGDGSAMLGSNAFLLVVGLREGLKVTTIFSLRRSHCSEELGFGVTKKLHNVGRGARGVGGGGLTCFVAFEFAFRGRGGARRLFGSRGGALNGFRLASRRRRRERRENALSSRG